MKRINRIFAASIVTILIPIAFASGQDMKNEHKYIITSTATAGNDDRRQVSKEITIISSDADMADQKGMDKDKQGGCESLVKEKKYTYTIESDNRDADSERAKYVINRDGIVITVEGSDYTKVKEIIKDIEKTLDTKTEVK